MKRFIIDALIATLLVWGFHDLPDFIGHYFLGPIVINSSHSERYWFIVRELPLTIAIGAIAGLIFSIVSRSDYKLYSLGIPFLTRLAVHTCPECEKRMSLPEILLERITGRHFLIFWIAVFVSSFCLTFIAKQPKWKMFKSFLRESF